MPAGGDTYLDIQEFLREHGRTLVDRLTRAVERSAEHFDAHGHAEHVTGELASGAEVIDSSGTFENLQTLVERRVTYLYDGLLALDLEDLAFALGAVTEADVDDLCVLRELDVVKNDERALDVQDGSVVNAGSDVDAVVPVDCAKMIFHVAY